MSPEDSQTKMVGASNIGFVLGILVIVAIAVYLFRSGFIANRFGLGQQATPSPSPTLSPLVEVTDEPITLLDENDDDADDNTTANTNRNTATTSARTHKPVETALGDNPIYLMLALLMGAGVLAVAAKKLA